MRAGEGWREPGRGASCSAQGSKEDFLEEEEEAEVGAEDQEARDLPLLGEN